MSEAQQDLYGRLGVSRNATAAEIHRGYRDRARRAHPDVATPTTVDEMALINEAWSVLGDPERRAAYDRATGQPSNFVFVSAPEDDETPQSPADRLVDARVLNRSTQRLLRTALLVMMLLVVGIMAAIFLIGFGRVGA